MERQGKHARAYKIFVFLAVDDETVQKRTSEKKKYIGRMTITLMHTNRKGMWNESEVDGPSIRK